TTGDAVGERLAFEQFHDQVVVADVVERADVGMVQRGDGLGLALEARAQVGAMRELRRKDFDRYAAVEARVTCAIDLAHSARPERRNDLVWTEARSWGDWHRGVRIHHTFGASGEPGMEGILVELTRFAPRNCLIRGGLLVIRFLLRLRAFEAPSKSAVA